MKPKTSALYDSGNHISFETYSNKKKKMKALLVCQPQNMFYSHSERQGGGRGDGGWRG